MISLDLRTGSGLSHTLSLPASPESLQWAKENLGITDFAEAEIISAHYEFPYLSVLVPSNLITVESANELASCLVKMRQEDYEVEKYLAILEAEQPETFQGALKLAFERDNYERVPMNSGISSRRASMWISSPANRSFPPRISLRAAAAGRLSQSPLKSLP